NPNANPNA
nr:Chain P, NPNA2 peptide [Plasmodium falciparum]6WFW_P Chain P, NPNA2 peptide [Plasmodium falciparum]